MNRYVKCTQTHRPYITKDKRYKVNNIEEHPPYSSGAVETVSFVDDRGIEVRCGILPDWVQWAVLENKIGGHLLTEDSLDKLESMVSENDRKIGEEV